MPHHSHVLVTRNLKAFKRVPSPIASLQARLFTLLQSPSSTSLRATFTCCLPSPSSDADFLAHLHHPPQIALVQGVVDPSNIILASSGGVTSSSASTHSVFRAVEAKKGWMADLAPDDVREVLFLPWALHAALEAAGNEGDVEGEGEASLMVLACLLFETAHWLFERTHGHRPRESLRTMQGKLTTSELEAVVASRKADDVGMCILSILVGADFELLTFADGNSKLVKLRLPAPHPPLLASSDLLALLATPLPRVTDVTAYGTTRKGIVPSWMAGESVFSVVKVEGVGGTCQHGLTARR